MEEIVVAPNLLCEGELIEGTLPMGSDSLKRKWVEEEERDPEKQDNKWTRTNRVDYCYLDDPFWEEDGDQDIIFTVSPSGELASLEEAKRSPEWSEWEK